jgi:hypothetical protein
MMNGFFPQVGEGLIGSPPATDRSPYLPNSFRWFVVPLVQGISDLVAGPLAGHALRYELAGLRSYSGPDVHLSDS